MPTRMPQSQKSEEREIEAVCPCLRSGHQDRLLPLTIMSLSFLRSFLQRLSTLRPFLLYGAAWTVLLTTAVAVASFAPELAFVSAVSPSSSLSRSCNADGFIRIPLDVPGEILCVPAQLVKRSRFDFLAPTVFAALVVAGSACVVRALALWDNQSY